MPELLAQLLSERARRRPSQWPDAPVPSVSARSYRERAVACLRLWDLAGRRAAEGEGAARSSGAAGDAEPTAARPGGSADPGSRSRRRAEPARPLAGAEGNPAQHLRSRVEGRPPGLNSQKPQTLTA